MLPYADRLVDVRRADWMKPIDALAGYVDASLPRVDEGGVLHTGQPWRCPADPDHADRTGFSYGYLPGAFMPSLAAYPLLDEDAAARFTTLLIYDKPPYTEIIFRDMGDWHPRAGGDSSRRNLLRFDGSVGPASDADGRG